MRAQNPSKTDANPMPSQVFLKKIRELLASTRIEFGFE
jgi:hypothetical protein